jgi:hypothetical protein
MATRKSKSQNGLIKSDINTAAKVIPPEQQPVTATEPKKVRTPINNPMRGHVERAFEELKQNGHTPDSIDRAKQHLTDALDNDGK